MKIIVTGAAGFIGSHMVRHMRDKGHDVVGVDIREGTDIKGDLRSMSICNQVFTQADWIVHLAADMGGVGYFHTKAGRLDPFINNMTMDMNVLQTAKNKGVERVFFSSSACVYPTYMQQDLTSVPLLAEHMIYPAKCDEHYGWEKLMALRLYEESDLDARVGILHTTYGPGQDWYGDRAKFPPSIAGKALAARQTGELEIWGDGSQMRSYQYIDDTVKKITAVLEADEYQGPVNIGYEGAVSCDDVALKCCGLLGINPTLIYNNAKPSGVLARDCDNSKFVERYGFDSEVSLEQGFMHLMTWIDSELAIAA